MWMGGRCKNLAKMGDILEHWEQRVVVVVPGDLSLDHQHSELLHLQVLLVAKSVEFF